MGLLIAGLTLWWLVPPHLSGRASALDQVEATLTDWRILAMGPRPAPSSVTIVAIDDRTLDRTMAFPLRRQEVAELVEAISAADPAALGLDVILVAEGEAAGDEALAAALSTVPTVIAGAATFGGKDVGGAVPTASTLIWPQTIFADKAAVGMVNLVTDRSGTPRHAPLLMLTAKGMRPHFCMQLAALSRGVSPSVTTDAVTIGRARHPLDLNFHMPLRLFGPSGTVETLSAADVLAGKGLDALAGRAVVLGVTASAAGDTFSTPFDPVVAGAELLAGATAQLLGADTLRRTPALRTVDAVAAGLLSVVSALLMAFLPFSIGLPSALGLLLLWLFLVGGGFAAGYWLAAALPVMAVAPVVSVTGLGRHAFERRMARRAAATADRLARFQPPALAARLANDPDYLAEPRTQTVAVLFVDLKNFTTISEAVGLDGTRAFLKAFHDKVARTIVASGGVVLNFMGDGAFAAFGLPDPQMDDADRAFRASVELLREVRALALPLYAGCADARIGLHRGDVVASRLGGTDHEQITLAGDPVNVASRLMDVAKANDARLAVSADLINAMRTAPDNPPDKVINALVRGRSARISVSVWCLDPA